MTTDDCSLPSNVEALLEETESLTWALLDGQLDDASGSRLTELLESHDLLRTRYVECVQLHIDLHDHFAGEPTEASGAKPRSAAIFPGLSTGGLPVVESPSTIGQ